MEKPPVYIPSRIENIVTFLQGLELRISRKRVLLVGPYVGEFGHEIMDFQAYVRWFKRKYTQIHVLTFPGREALYRGCIVHTHNHDLKTAGYHYGRLSDKELRQEADQFARSLGLANYDVFNAAHLRTRWHRRLLFRQAHEVLGPLKPAQERINILFHFRNINKAGYDNTRNIQPELAAELCRLSQRRGYSIACIGHPLYSLCPESCRDLRSSDLENTLDAIASSRLLVGELSGPIHLAVYSATPVVIWAPGKHRVDYALKRNPFRVAISVVRDDTTNPPAQEVLATMDAFLDQETPG